jgi:hypothetical protein
VPKAASRPLARRSCRTLGPMNRRRIRSSAVGAALILSSVLSQAEPTEVPKPFIIAPACSAEQTAAAMAIAAIQQPPAACFLLEKWSFRGVALATVPEGYVNRSVTKAEFLGLRKAVFRDQSVRLRAGANLDDALPGQPPSHASIPSSLFVKVRTPLGVFLDEPNHIGFADLVPAASSQSATGIAVYPLIELETWVYASGHVFKLIQISPISGASTIGEGYRMADDWARRFNGSERLATED